MANAVKVECRSRGATWVLPLFLVLPTGLFVIGVFGHGELSARLLILGMGVGLLHGFQVVVGVG